MARANDSFHRQKQWMLITGMNCDHLSNISNQFYLIKCILLHNNLFRSSSLSLNVVSILIRNFFHLIKNRRDENHVHTNLISAAVDWPIYYVLYIYVTYFNWSSQWMSSAHRTVPPYLLTICLIYIWNSGIVGVYYKHKLISFHFSLHR